MDRNADTALTLSGVAALTLTAAAVLYLALVPVAVLGTSCGLPLVTAFHERGTGFESLLTNACSNGSADRLIVASVVETIGVLVGGALLALGMFRNRMTW